MSLWAAWLLGLSMGLTGCAVACLPAMAGWAVGRAGGGRAALWDLAGFAAGRVTGYAMLGGLAGALGQGLVASLTGGAGRLWLGGACLLAAFVLLLPRRVRRDCLRRGGELPPLLIGVGMALVPCAPLAALAASCAASGSFPAGLAAGLAFGLGAATTPLLALVPALAALSRGLGRRRAWMAPALRLGGAAALVLIGGRELFSIQ